MRAGELSPAPPRPALQITIMGNSQAVWVAPARESRDDRNYGEYLEALLVEAGIATRTTNLARWNEQVPKALCQFESAIRSGGPDVVILQYGGVESFPMAFPIWLHTYLHTWHVHAGWRTKWRNLVRRLLWRRLRSWQTFLARTAGQRTHRIGPERFAREFTKLLDDIHREQHALVLVMSIPRVSNGVLASVPGLDERFRRYNEIMRRACERDPVHRRFYDLDALIDTPAVLPDGLHLEPSAHLTVARALLEAVLTWVREDSGTRYRSP